jgi:hypothetical protein
LLVPGYSGRKVEVDGWVIWAWAHELDRELTSGGQSEHSNRKGATASKEERISGREKL